MFCASVYSNIISHRSSVFEGRHNDHRSSKVGTSIIHLRRSTHLSSILKGDTSIVDLRKSTHRSSKVDTSIIDLRHIDFRRSKVEASHRQPKDILCLERVQRRATKFICNDFAMDYKSRLMSLRLLPLMTWLELQDIMFLVRCLKRSMDNLEITKVLSFVSSTTRAASNNKLCHNFSRLIIVHHFYYNRIVRLWNAIPTIDLTQSYTSIKN